MSVVSRDVSWRVVSDGSEPYRPLDMTKIPTREDALTQNAGAFIGPLLRAGDDYAGYLYSSLAAQPPFSANAWCGAGVVMSREYFATLSGFDERFFLYFEDVEFAWRGTLAGLPPLVDPRLRVNHHHSAITSSEPRRRERSVLQNSW